MATVGNVIFQISADMKNIQGQLRTLENSFQSSFNRIEAGAKAAARGFLNAFGIGLGIAGMVAFTKSLVELGDQLNDLSEATGLSIEMLGGIKPVAETSGTSLEALSKGVLKAQRDLGDLTGTGKEAGAALKAIGLDAQGLASASPDEFLEKLVNALGTVENRSDRAAVAFRILGKSGQELIPTILKLAEGGIPKLSEGASAAYKSLADMKDQVVELDAKLKNLAATVTVSIAKFFGLVELPLIEQLGKAATEVKRLTTAFSRASGLSIGEIDAKSIEQLKELSGKTAFGDMFLPSLIAAREQQEKLLAAMRQTREESSKGGPSKNLFGDADKQKKLQSALDNYRQSLIKTVTQQEIEQVKLTLGEQAALKAAQAYEVLSLRARMLADAQREGKPANIPQELQRAAVEAEATLKSLGANIDILSERSLANLQQRVLDGAGSLEQLKQSLDATAAAVQAFADAANEGVGIQLLSREDVARINDAKRELDDLRTNLGLGAMDVSTPEGRERKRLAEIHVEFAKTAARIEELGRAAGLSQEQIAEDVRLAWKKALADIGVQADEASAFWTRAIESVQDAVAGGINDILQGNVKSWEDWGNNIKRVIDGVVSQFLAAQLNAAVFGPQAGQGQGQIGGLIGKLLGFAGLFGGGGGDVFAGGATGYEAGFYHEGGAVQKASMAAFVRGSGLKNDEVPVVLQAGEFVINKDSAMRFGAPNLEKINRLHTGGLVASRFDTGVLNRMGAMGSNMSSVSTIAGAVRERSGEAGNSYGPFVFNGVDNFDSFRRSKASLLADLARAVERGKQHT